MWAFPLLSDPESTISDQDLADFAQKSRQWVIEAMERHGLRQGTHFRREHGQLGFTMRGATAILIVAGHALCAREIMHKVPRDVARMCLDDWTVCAALRGAGVDPEGFRAHDDAVRECAKYAAAIHRAARALDARFLGGNSLSDAAASVTEALRIMDQCRAA